MQLIFKYSLNMEVWKDLHKGPQTGLDWTDQTDFAGPKHFMLSNCGGLLLRARKFLWRVLWYTLGSSLGAQFATTLWYMHCCILG